MQLWSNKFEYNAMKITGNIMSRNYIKGFTLIELLVVISIIGILSGMMMANFLGIRQRSRDGVRKSDLRQIQTALEMYRADNSGVYPASGVGGFPTTCGAAVSFASATVTYMKAVPCDPLDGTTSYSYTPQAGNTAYTLYGCLENTSDPQKTANGGCASGYSITLNNP